MEFARCLLVGDRGCRLNDIPRTNPDVLPRSAHLAPPIRVAVLLVGVLAISTGAILVVEAEGVPAISKAAWRTSLAGLLLIVPVMSSARHRTALLRLSRTDKLHILAAGLALAAHFGLWIPSLDFTSVASSVVLVTLSPLFVAVLSHSWLQETVSRGTRRGIALALLGSIVVGWGDAALGSRELFGDALAIGGALAAAIYFLIGRSLRRHLALLPYIASVYAVAGVCLTLLATARGDALFGFEPRAWIMLILLAIVPQIIGHGTLNWALASLSAAFVAIVTLGEPIASSILAWLLLDQVPGLRTLGGGALVLAGLFVASRSERAGQTIDQQTARG